MKHQSVFCYGAEYKFKTQPKEENCQEMCGYSVTHHPLTCQITKKNQNHFKKFFFKIPATITTITITITKIQLQDFPLCTCLKAKLLMYLTLVCVCVCVEFKDAC